MAKDKKVLWSVYNISEKIKNEFLGIAKMQGKATAPLLENILRRYIYDVQHGEDKEA